VNAAINLCEAARRDKKVIIIDQGFYQCLDGSIKADVISGDKLGKAQRYTPCAYEVQGLIRPAARIQETDRGADVASA
jgi:hypothetical protein